MKTEVFTAPKCYSTADLFSSVQSQNLLRSLVIKYLDYFFPNVSGASSVAIDNKIEQAMDLVKSHLMYTVREEVEVLKERIAELLERINQLEVENSFLRANVSPDVLLALNSGAAQNNQNQQQQPQQQQPAATNGAGTVVN